MRPQGVALAHLELRVWLERENDMVKDIHIAVGPGGGTPFRATEAEDILRGQPFNDETFDKHARSPARAGQIPHQRPPRQRRLSQAYR